MGEEVYISRVVMELREIRRFQGLDKKKYGGGLGLVFRLLQSVFRRSAKLHARSPSASLKAGSRRAGENARSSG